MERSKPSSEMHGLGQMNVKQLLESLAKSDAVLKEQKQTLEKLKIEANEIQSNSQQSPKPSLITFKKSKSPQANQHTYSKTWRNKTALKLSKKS